MKAFQISWVTGFAVLMLFVAGCGEEQAEQGAEAPEDTTEQVVDEVDIYAEAPLIRVGYVGHDHHSAVYVSALRGERMAELYGIYLVPLREGELYALVEDGVKIAEVEFLKASGGGSIVPTSMAAGEFDMGFGGVAAFAASADGGSGVAIVAPAHTGGDMLVVGPENEDVVDWPSFIEWVVSSEAPIVVGYKNPKAVAKVIFEGALVAEGIEFSQGTADPGSQIVMMNMQGEPNLIPGLESGTIDAYVSNNPWCALAEYNEQGHCVAELPQLPPGTWVDHPCCAVAATLEARTEKAHEVAAVLRLVAGATDYINCYPDDAAEAVAEWLGNPVEVEIISMATSGYDSYVTDHWLDNMRAIVDNMRNLNVFSGPLVDGDWETISSIIFDWSLLPEGYGPAI